MVMFENSFIVSSFCPIGKMTHLLIILPPIIIRYYRFIKRKGAFNPDDRQNRQKMIEIGKQ